jgi:DNA-binding GntR family transcriptional regulator
VSYDDSHLELRSLQQQIHDRLLGRVLRGELGPGERISPPEIAASLGVSVTPVRDAVNQMAAEGLVTVIPRRGTIVSPVSARDIEELYEIRLMLEPRAAELSAERAAPADRTRMRELADRLDSGPSEDGAESMDLDTYLQEISTDAEFHALVVTTAGNRRLAALYDGLRVHVLIARTIFPRLYRRRPHRRGEHQRIAAAIGNHDMAGARDAMTTHLQKALADTMRHVQSSGGSATSEPPASTEPDRESS